MSKQEFSRNFQLNCIAVANNIIVTKKLSRKLLDECENVEEYNSKIINTKHFLTQNEFEFLKLFFEKTKEW